MLRVRLVSGRKMSVRFLFFLVLQLSRNSSGILAADNEYDETTFPDDPASPPISIHATRTPALTTADDSTRSEFHDDEVLDSESDIKEYLGSGYDICRANPILSKLDPGLGVSHLTPILPWIAEENGTVQEHSIGRRPKILKQMLRYDTFQDGQRSLRKFMMIHVDPSTANNVTAAFGISENSLLRTSLRSSSITKEVKAKLIRRVSLRVNHLSQFSDEFNSEICLLPVIYFRETYEAFFRKFGTHLVGEVSVARVSVQETVTPRGIRNISQNSHQLLEKRTIHYLTSTFASSIHEIPKLIIPKRLKSVDCGLEEDIESRLADIKKNLNQGLSEYFQHCQQQAKVDEEGENGIGRINAVSNSSQSKLVNQRAAQFTAEMEQIANLTLFNELREEEISQLDGLIRNVNVSWASAVSQLELQISGKRPLSSPSKPDLTVKRFLKQNMTTGECQLFKTSNCFVADWSDCPDAHYGFQCTSNADDAEVRTFLRNIKTALPDQAIKFGVSGTWKLKKETFVGASDNIVVLIMSQMDDFNCDVLKDVDLPNLLCLAFDSTKNIIIRRNSLSKFQKVTLLVFRDSTILSLEQGVLESLLSLKLVLFDMNLVSPLPSDLKSHVFRLHCSADYSWLRDYLTQHPQLIQPKKTGEVIDVSGWSNGELGLRDIFYPADCSRADLTGVADQTAFSINVDTDDTA